MKPKLAFAKKRKRSPKDKPRIRRVYTDQDKAAALAHLQSCGGVISRAARELGIPIMTLCDWAAGRSLGPNVTHKFRVVKQTLSAKLEDVAQETLDAMPDKIEAAPLRDLSVTLGLTIDRMKLLREEPTLITESTRRAEILEQLIEQTMERFPGMSREEAIDIIRDVKPEAIRLLR